MRGSDCQLDPLPHSVTPMMRHRATDSAQAPKGTVQLYPKRARGHGVPIHQRAGAVS